MPDLSEVLVDAMPHVFDGPSRIVLIAQQRQLTRNTRSLSHFQPI